MKAVAGAGLTKIEVNIRREILKLKETFNGMLSAFVAKVTRSRGRSELPVD